jgi:hypothetical protein
LLPLAACALAPALHFVVCHGGILGIAGRSWKGVLIVERASTLQGNLQSAAHELVRRNTGRGGDTQTDVATALGMERGRLSQLLNKPGEPMPLHVAVALSRVLRDDYLMQAVCEACGGVFLALPESRPLPGHAQQAFQHAMELLGVGLRESGEALAVATEVIRDRVATRVEKGRARAEILETISALAQLLRAIDAMPERGGVDS